MPLTYNPADASTAWPEAQYTAMLQSVMDRKSKAGGDMQELSWIVYDDANNRHVNPRWARDKSSQFGELLREQIRHERSIEEALVAYDEFVAKIPATLLSAHAYLAGARPHTFTCLDPKLRRQLWHLGGPELGTGVLERLMRELNARTDIGGSRWSINGLRDLLTVQTARLLGHPSWTELHRSTHRPNTIKFRLQKFNAA